MKRLISLGWLTVAAVAVVLVFQLSDDVQRMEKELRTVQQQILRDQEAIHVLEAEWSYLNRPDVIEEMARRHLSLNVMPPDKILAFEDLPWRPLSEQEVDAAKARYLPDGSVIPGLKPLLVGAGEGLRP